jgi:hypothetical protein
MAPYNWREYFLSARRTTRFMWTGTHGQVPMDDWPIRGVRTYLHV